MTLSLLTFNKSDLSLTNLKHPFLHFKLVGSKGFLEIKHSYPISNAIVIPSNTSYAFVMSDFHSACIVLKVFLPHR